MSNHRSNLEPPHAHSYADVLPRSPALTSDEAGWDSISLEYHHQPAGETPKLCFEHYVIGLFAGQSCQLEYRTGRHIQQKTIFTGAAVFCPMHHPHSFRWDRDIHALALNVKPKLLVRNATELLGSDHVELLPQVMLYDPLVYQIGLALKADLESCRPGGRLYAENLANALAVHLLRHYSSQNRQSIHHPDGLSFNQLRQVIDYIHDYLDQDLGLDELASIAKLSQYHFSRSFKQSTGFSPHQYVIRQRVERAKQLLKQGKKISEVAIVCGFTHQSHLHRHFKRLTGVTPKTFLKS